MVAAVPISRSTKGKNQLSRPSVSNILWTWQREKELQKGELPRPQIVYFT